MKGIKHECQLMERSDVHDHGVGVRECGKVRQLSGRRSDSSQGGVKFVSNLFQLMERYDGHGGDVRGLGRCDSCQGV